MSGEDRLQSVETALAHAETAIDDLSQMIQAHEADMAALRLEIRRLQARLSRLEEDGSGEDMHRP
jgi:uncharacterized coiled-coil protein SlyX